jgi:hypothetical protein
MPLLGAGIYGDDGTKAEEVVLLLMLPDTEVGDGRTGFLFTRIKDWKSPRLK